METIKLITKDTDTVLQKLIDLKNTIEYDKENISHFYDLMEAWEKKEYKQILSEKETELIETIEYCKKHSLVFDELLKKYGLNLESFINTYIN